MDFDDIAFEGGEIGIDSDLLESDIDVIDQELPEEIFIIPIRYRPIFPGIVTPLIISRGRYTKAIDEAIATSRTIGLVLINDDEKEEISPGDIYSVGTAARVLKKINLPDGGVNVLINSVKRFKIKDAITEKGSIFATVSYREDSFRNVRELEIKALTREILGKLKRLSEDNPLFTEEMKLTMLNVDEPGKIADFVTSILNIERQEYQDILETLNVQDRLHKVLLLLHKEMEVMEVQKKIQGQINDKIDRQQRDFFLREQLKAIKGELGIDEDDRGRDMKELLEKARELELKGEAREKFDTETDKLMVMDPSSSEYTVARNYVDTLLSLPWNIKTDDSIDLELAEKVLNRDHYGLDDVKERILEFIAVRKLKPDSRGSILCLVGPPGVGKTSLGRSIARALNRKFFRISVGGMRDEAEIKGHRRTYVGAMPGKIIQGLKIAKARNPVFMLDEIDKMGQSYQGDPASALLEVLDPEQNSEFRDYYIDAPFDLSDILFITTANTLDTIPPVLADRMEVIRLSGYIPEEKYQIGRRYLLPKQMKMHGLERGTIKMKRRTFLDLVNGWARESGVRNLERQIEKICRKEAARIARKGTVEKKELHLENLREYLGPERFLDENFMQHQKPGLVTGLAWTSMGGDTLVIEAIGIGNRKEGLQMTGQLGEVMTESGNIAYSFIQSLLSGENDYSQWFENHMVHLHVPAGATPKDGPSAGITMASAVYSLVTQSTVGRGIAMTGELTLTGRVYPVGGIKEKIIAAKRYGLKHVILPRENSRDLEEIPEYVKKGLKFHLVESFNEVLDVAFSKGGR